MHISDSEDESEEYITDEEREEGEEGDPEMQAGRSGLVAETGPPTSCIIPTYRCSMLFDWYLKCQRSGGTVTRRYMLVPTRTHGKEFTSSSLITPTPSGDQRLYTTGSITPNNLGQILKSKYRQKKKETVQAKASETNILC